MSTQALKAAVTGQAPAKTKDKPKTLAGLMADPAIKEQIALALPKHMTADRLARIATTELRRNAALARCDQVSFLGAVMQCAQLGLELGGALGHAYLIPFENRRKGITEVQFIVGYRGMIDLARRSGQILSIEARAVYETDKFHVALGLESDLKHEPDWTRADRGPLKFVYAVAKLKGGGTQFEVMSRAEIEAVRAGSRSKDNGPWVTHFEEMGKKTVIRRLFKYLPVSIEMQLAVGLDEQVEVGLPQDNPLTFDAETGEIFGGDDAAHGNQAQTGQASEQQRGAQGDQPAKTYAEVADLIAKAKDAEGLDLARGHIGSVPDDQFRAELNALAAKRFAELKEPAQA